MAKNFASTGDLSEKKITFFGDRHRSLRLYGGGRPEYGNHRR
ncbi:hypothetical protein ACVWW3_006459 [Bradyrhizobium sp. LM2.9]